MQDYWFELWWCWNDERKFQECKIIDSSRIFFEKILSSSPSGILTVPRKPKWLKEKTEKTEKQNKTKQKTTGKQSQWPTLTDSSWHRKIRSLLTHVSVSAREVNMIRCFYSITFQDAVERIIDNLSLTSKPQGALSWSCFSAHHMNKQKWSQEASWWRNADHPKTTWFISVIYFSLDFN